MSPEGVAKRRALLTRHEGSRLVVYDDFNGKPVRKGSTLIGNPTIGVGRNLSGRGISSSEQALLLDNDIAECEAVLSKQPWWGKLNEPRQAAAIDLAFMGWGSFQKFVNLFAAITIENWDLAAQEVLDSKWATDVGPIRSGDIARMMRTGEW